MTPLEKAKAEEGRVNYCDECEQFIILNDAPYCKVDGKLIHPIMMVRGQGTGPAWNCKKRHKPITNYDRIISQTPEELATWLNCNPRLCPPPWMNGLCPDGKGCENCWLEWLKQEVESND